MEYRAPDGTQPRGNFICLNIFHDLSAFINLRQKERFRIWEIVYWLTQSHTIGPVRPPCAACCFDCPPVTLTY